MAQVKISEDTWRRLNAQKAPGDTFDDVVQDLLDRHQDGVEELTN